MKNDERRLAAIRIALWAIAVIAMLVIGLAAWHPWIPFFGEEMK